MAVVRKAEVTCMVSPPHATPIKECIQLVDKAQSGHMTTDQARISLVRSHATNSMTKIKARISFMAMPGRVLSVAK